MWRIVSAFILSWLATFTLASAQGQQSGAVDVLAADATTHAPLAGVRVYALGSARRALTTGADGHALFDALPAGAYSIIVFKSGYDSHGQTSITVAVGAEITVTVEMNRPLTAIGRVIVTVGPLSPNQVAADDPRLATVDSTKGLLEKLPDVQLATGSDGALGAGVGGHAASQATISLDGAPIAVAGRALDLRALPVGLFEGADAAGVSRAGALGGHIDLHIAEPTLSAKTVLRETVSRNSTSTFTTKGTAGYLGYSVAFAGSNSVDIPAGVYLADQTGFSYAHHDNGTAGALAAKFRIPFGIRGALTVSAIHGTARQSLFCRVAATTPCGYGPGSSVSHALDVLHLRQTWELGSIDISADAASSSIKTHFDEPARTFLRRPFALSGRGGSAIRDVSITVRPPDLARHRIMGRFETLSVTPSGDQAAGVSLLSDEAHRLRAVDVDDTYRASNRFSLRAGIGYRSTDVASGAVASAEATMAFRAKQRLSATVIRGERGIPQSAASGFGDPADAQYACEAGLAFTSGQGPSARASVARSDEARLTYTQQDPKRQTYVSAYVQEQHETPLFVTTAPAMLPPGYQNSIAEAFHDPLICGAAPFHGIILTVPAAASRVRYSGFTSSLRLPLSSQWAIVASFAYTRAMFMDGSALFSESQSDVVRGVQLPGVPPVNGAVTLTREFSSTVSAITEAAYYGGNSAFGPAAIRVSMGAVAKLPRGRLTAAIANIGGSSSTFATYAAAVRTAGGASLPRLVYSRDPASVLVTYQTNVGPPATRPNDSELTGQSESAQFELEPLPATPPAEPFAIASDNPECGPERARVARRVFERLRTTMSRPAATNLEGISLGDSVHTTILARPAMTALVAASSKPVTAALVACAHVHGGGRTAMEALGLYIPTPLEAERIDLLYSPRVGFYIVDFTTVQ